MSGQPLWGDVVAGLLMLVFGLMFLTLFGFMSYSFLQWIRSIITWFHTRHMVRSGQQGVATLVDRRSAIVSRRGGPFTLVVTMEFHSADGILHRREFRKYADIARMPDIGSRYPVFYDPAHPDDFAMQGSWIGPVV